MKVTTALVALLIVGTSAFATGGKSDDKKPAKSKVAIINNSQSKYKLVYMDESRGKVFLKVKNASGEIVDSRTVKNDGGFALPYDFESLPSGEYMFEIEAADGTIETQLVEHVKKTPARKSVNELKANVLDINDNQKYRLAAISNNDSPISVKIYGDNNSLLHSEVIDETQGFRKTFDLKDVDSESIRFEVSNGKKSVSLTAK